jgi:hypothetical protein
LRTSFERFGDNSFLVSFPSELFNIFEMEETFSKGSGQKLCRAQNAFKKKSGELDVWCEKTCSAGDCPDLLCVCTSPRS